jgi:hypothetical protein
MQILRIMAPGLVLMIIAGCAAKGTGPVFQLNPAPDGMAAVYHYRLETGYGSGAAYTLVSNGQVASVIGNGGYYIQHLKPGEYKYEKIFTQHGGPFLIGQMIDNARAKPEYVYAITVKPNKGYFLHWSPPGKIEPVEEDTALKEVHGLREFEPAK